MATFGSRSEALLSAAASSSSQQPRQPLRVYHYLILISLNSIGAFSSDCYVPNLSDIVRDLNATDQQVSLTIQLNWITLGLATPVVGYLSDIYGRKIIIVLTLLVYVVGAVGSGVAPTIGWLLVARCVQGIGESVSIITSSIIRDEIDDKQERMKVQAYFTTMRPLMLLGGPSIGGVIGTAVGWRKLMYGLSVWGVLTILLMYFIPESNAAARRGGAVAPPSDAAEHTQLDAPSAGDAPKPPALRSSRVGGGGRWSSGWLDCEKLRRMAFNADFVGLTMTAAFCMACVRAMLSNISFVYTHYYQLSTAIGGLLISIPPLCGFISSLIAARLAAKTTPASLARYGMAAGIVPPVLMLISAGRPQCTDCLYARPRWYMTTAPCALVAAVGFFALPAMQVLVLHDFKDMSGLAGGISKLVMTLTSTLASMLVSFYFSDWGRDHKGSYTHYHTQRLLYALAAILLVMQLWFWLVYIPIKRCGRRRRQAASSNANANAAGASILFGAGDDQPLPLSARRQASPDANGFVPTLMVWPLDASSTRGRVPSINNGAPANAPAAR